MNITTRIDRYKGDWQLYYVTADNNRDGRLFFTFDGLNPSQIREIKKEIEDMARAETLEALESCAVHYGYSL